MAVLLLLAAALATPPQGTLDQLQLSALVLGETHGCGLRADGAVACWGAGDRGQTGGPASATPAPVAGLTDAVALTAGDHHTCALLRDRHVWCWGDNQSGQVGQPAGDPRPAAAEVPGLGAALSVAAGALHTCAVTADGHVACWGDNLYGQLGLPDIEQSPFPLPVPGIERAFLVAAGYGHSCAAVHGDPSVPDAPDHLICWGDGARGQLGGAEAGPALVAASSERIRGLAARQHQTCALDAAGVTCWGAAPDAAEPQPTPTRVVEQTGLVALTIGWGHGCAWSGGGRVTCWGDDREGQLGARLHRPVVHGAFGVQRAVGVAAGWHETCAARERGATICWGSYTPAEEARVQRETPPEPTGPRDRERQLPPGTELIVRTEEVLGLDGARVRVQVQTVASQPCANTKLSIVPTFKGKVVKLDIGPPILPDGVCLATPAPASGSYDLPVDTSGRRDVVLRWDRKEDMYQVYVSDTKIEVIPLQATFTTFRGDPLTWRARYGSLAISCVDHTDSPVCVRRAALGLPSCRALLTETTILDAPKLDDHTWASPFFAADPHALRISPDSGHEALRALFEKRYEDGSGCTEIDVRTWTGETWTNMPR